MTAISNLICTDIFKWKIFLNLSIRGAFSWNDFLSSPENDLLKIRKYTLKMVPGVLSYLLCRLFHNTSSVNKSATFQVFDQQIYPRTFVTKTLLFISGRSDVLRVWTVRKAQADSSALMNFIFPVSFLFSAGYVSFLVRAGELRQWNLYSSQHLSAHSVAIPPMICSLILLKKCQDFLEFHASQDSEK